ncbi:U3 small nucleolar ribonucleoprotein protein MPP10-like [Daktulosphaira vitifoliae]|uniref:U3 small nucleolar ribonucleoprotein protein MPP10-like n=1 Tax=Daktulosphaira vitifoliae TaxID=58002 RepID=UPI0021AA017C|nr:U3 small nucleolar ribonucleoprotein protein MPP10-like [Daktulosphaira vitifoliae]
MITLNFINTFDSLTKNPLEYLDVQTHVSDKISNFLKELYDSTKSTEVNLKNLDDALPELIINEFDEEQIWQELELQNSTRFKFLAKNIQQITDNDLNFLSSVGNNKNTIESQSDSEENSECSFVNTQSETEIQESESENNEIIDDRNTLKSNYVLKKSIVDDDFFKLSEMENFLLSEEKTESGKQPISNDDDDIDLFQNLETSDNEVNENYGPMYNDFFENNVIKSNKSNASKKMVRFETDNEDNCNENNIELNSGSNVLSSMEKRSKRIKERIAKLEEEAISERPWGLKGEVSAKDRPQNSLLEEAVEFDVCTRPAPIITEETTLKLEDIIRQRIKDKSWDDVERKIKPTKAPHEFKKQLILNQEKSKESLSQIYEKEFINQREAANPENKNKLDEEPKEHKEIDLMIKELFKKLDALTNYHYTPKQAIPELKIVNNLPAISMEEVAPTTTTEATLLAPEEIQNKYKAPILGKEERTDTDKKRERRKKKLLQHKKRLIKDAKDKDLEKTGIKFKNKENFKQLKLIKNDGRQVKQLKAIDDKSMKSSKEFFSRLQDEAKKEIDRKKRSSSINYEKNGKKMKTKI